MKRRSRVLFVAVLGLALVAAVFARLHRGVEHVAGSRGAPAVEVAAPPTSIPAPAPERAPAPSPRPWPAAVEPTAPTPTAAPPVAETPPSSPHGSTRPRVKKDTSDRSTADPPATGINRASWSLDQASTVAKTDEAGRFRLEGAPAGAIRLHAQKEQLAGDSEPVQVTAGSEVGGVAIRLLPQKPDPVEGPR